jgi:hypothetical protein
MQNDNFRNAKLSRKSFDKRLPFSSMLTKSQ